MEKYTTKININNTHISPEYIDYIEENRKENTVFVHLVSGVSFLFCSDDWETAIYNYKKPQKRGLL